MNAVETIIMQAILKSVREYENVEVLRLGVEKYFTDNYHDIWYLCEWNLVDGGNNIEITYMRQYTSGTMERRTDIIPTETIVSIAVELSFNKN